MPVIFNTPTSHRVFMLDKDADYMLKAMQTSGNIPGALFPDNLKDAFEALQSEVEKQTHQESLEPSADIKSDHIAAKIKATPLINLIRSAMVNDEKLMWDRE